MLPASNLFHFHIVLEVCCRNVGTATRIKEHPLLWDLRYFHSKDFTSGGQSIVIRGRQSYATWSFCFSVNRGVSLRKFK